MTQGDFGQLISRLSVNAEYFFIILNGHCCWILNICIWSYILHQLEKTLKICCSHPSLWYTCYIFFYDVYAILGKTKKIAANSSFGKNILSCKYWPWSCAVRLIYINKIDLKLQLLLLPFPGFPFFFISSLKENEQTLAYYIDILFFFFTTEYAEIFNFFDFTYFSLRFGSLLFWIMVELEQKH